MSNSISSWKRRASVGLWVAGLLVVAGCGSSADVGASGIQAGSSPLKTASAGETATPANSSANTDPMPTKPATLTPGEATSGNCAANNTDQKMPSETDPISIDAWLNVEGMGIPVSDTYGPVNRDGEVWSCFAHSPKGAVQAALYITAITTTSNDARREYYVNAPEELISAKPNRTSLAEFEVIGYSIEAYDAESAIVDVAMAASYQGKAYPNSLRVTLVWENGWKQDISKLSENSATLLTNYSGYLTWPK